MSDPIMGWFEIIQYDEKMMTITNFVGTVWITRHPCPIYIIYDKVSQFLGRKFKKNLIQREYEIKTKPVTS